METLDASTITNLPERTVERLSEYRRTLLSLLSNGHSHIYSHELAGIHAITAVQVRRDLMLIGFSTVGKKGYNVRELIDFIGSILDSADTSNVGVIGMGNLAQAITHYFNGKRSKLKIVAAFDVDPEKINTMVSGIECYSIERFTEIAAKYNIKIILLTLPTSASSSVAEIIKDASIRGVLNFTSATLNLPESVYVEDYDMITLLEKVAYYSK